MRLLRIIVFFLLAALPLAAQKQPFSVERLLSLERVSDPQVSPDGRTVLYTVMTPNAQTNARPVQVWSVPIGGGPGAQLTRDGTSNQRPRWSPDGKRVAYLSNRGGSQQIWTMDPDGGNARQVTDYPVDVDGEMWSPDGSKMLFIADVYPACGADMACNKRQDEAREKDPVKAKVFTRLLYRHWTAFKNEKRSHLFVIASSGGVPIDLTPGDFDVPPFSLDGVDEYAFSPDGTEVAYTSDHSKVEATSTDKDIFIVPVTGEPARQLTKNPAWDATPAYSPDGRFIAYRAMRRPGYESDRFELMLYDRHKDQLRELTRDYDRSIGSILWSPESTRIYFTTEDELTDPILWIAADGGQAPHYVVKGASNSDVSITRDGRTLVFTRSSLTRPSEVFTAPTPMLPAAEARGAKTPPGRSAAPVTENPTMVTHVNDAALADVEMPAPEHFTYTGAAGATIHAWLIKPPGFDPAKKYPAQILIHGGPQGAWTDGWSYRWNGEAFAAAGYVIVEPNPRGSTGFGQRFVDDINADWGGKAYEDIMKGADYVEKLPYVDRARIGASGASYGGYMVDWIAGHTNRFKCLVTHDGVFDLVSMYGSTEELWFPEWEFKGTPWSNPEMYRRWSPSTYVANFKTPTLVVHGQLDYRVDVSQGFEMFTSLQKMNVPSKMLYFPDEGHWVLKPANSLRWYKEVLGWWNQWLK